MQKITPKQNRLRLAIRQLIKSTALSLKSKKLKKWQIDFIMSNGRNYFNDQANMAELSICLKAVIADLLLLDNELQEEIKNFN